METNLMGPFDIVTVGHFSIDLIRPPNRNWTKLTLGGAPTYVSLTAKKLGADVSVISKVGVDFPDRFQQFLEHKRVNLSGLKKDENASTTSFLLNYEKSGERNLILRKKAPSIKADDIPEVLKTKVFHVAPIANEIPRKTLLKLKASDSTISLDPQGFVRKFKENGKVYLGQLEDPEVLKKVDILKASFDEAKVITGQTNLVGMVKNFIKKEIKIIIITRGAKATLLCVEGKLFSVPSAKPRVVVDTTGAGDVCIGAFLTMFVRGEEPLWCACVGSAAASFVVEKYGPSGFGSLKQVRARAIEVHNKASVVS
jgi:sugar/nucleoside kinase (ribokinase family)